MSRKSCSVVPSASSTWAKSRRACSGPGHDGLPRWPAYLGVQGTHDEVTLYGAVEAAKRVGGRGDVLAVRCAHEDYFVEPHADYVIRRTLAWAEQIALHPPSGNGGPPLQAEVCSAPGDQGLYHAAGNVLVKDLEDTLDPERTTS